MIAGYQPGTGAAGGGAVQASNSGCGEPSAGSGGAIEFALKQQGKPYVWAASGPDAFDCSGLVLRAYQAAGVRLPRTSREQYHAGVGQAQTVARQLAEQQAAELSTRLAALQQASGG